MSENRQDTRTVLLSAFSTFKFYQLSLGALQHDDVTLLGQNASVCVSTRVHLELPSLFFVVHLCFLQSKRQTVGEEHANCGLSEQEVNKRA